MSVAASNLSREELLALYQRMLLIRRMEEQLARDCAAGKLPGPVHLYVGQEAIAVGVCHHLEDRDWITSTHRGHGHFLAKGGDPARMMAEIYGRADGICGGFGGSMHVADFSKGIIGANGIVGGGIALATGAALAAQLDGDGKVAVAFFGDGAANQGVLMEALNVGALWKLPLILICENNGFSEFSPTATVTAGRIVERARPFGVPALKVDGNDVLAVWQAANQAVRRAREGGGPTLIEAITYRTRGHVEYEVTFITEPYRSEAEVEAWRAKDPIGRFAAYLATHGLAAADELEAIERAVGETVAEAVRVAEASPEPDPASATGHMFANPR
ncbi:MAG: thiamine pyrophosphate-dependent dehydrogenase E1 component subunit alpha [Geminicoccaceae bacterium]|nr:thiamine pyrophosphate-dependent dehydrogenase E1 component subunit alpha [Geminicoccaceae bacterium]MDW8370179.1 thiamine pyrophosphate-dependent dehydrogenase E1 component subunit alpha [Geminicoccaceae bacterium]